MLSRLQHLQLAKLHPSTRVASTKLTSWLRALGFKDFCHIPLGSCSGFKAKRCNFSSFCFSFSLLFILEDTLASFSWGSLTYLKVVNGTRVGFAKFRRLGSSSAYC